MFGVPESTLRDRTLGLQCVPDENGFLPNSGPPPMFSKTQERDLIEHVTYMSTLGYIYSTKEFFRLATDFAISLKKKTESDPQFNTSWLSRFRKRNPGLTLEKPQKLAAMRTEATSEAVLGTYFRDLEVVFQDNNVMDSPHSVWTVIETSIVLEQTCSGTCHKDTNQSAVTSPQGKSVTVIAAWSAAGTRIPPFYVFPGTGWTKDLLNGTTHGSNGAFSESGLTTHKIFHKYMNKHFVQHVPGNGSQVVILVDGHKSHANLTLKEWGDANNTVFFPLPPNTSHVTRPLDMGCFGLLKKAYNSEIEAYLSSVEGVHINRCNIARVLEKAYNKVLTPDNTILSFQKSGIFPLQDHVSADNTASVILHQLVDVHEVSEINSALHDWSTRPVNKDRKRKTHCDKQPNTSKKVRQESKAPARKTSVAKRHQTQQSSPSPSSYEDYLHSDSHGDSEDDDPEVDRCCVCGHVTPEAIDETEAEFVDWGQCDICSHWTHLTYCCKVKSLLDNDTFFCPHCEN